MFAHFRRNVPVLLTVLISMLFLEGCADAGNWEKHIVKEEIFLQGLNGEYDFLFLTDTHMVVLSDEDSPQERTSAGERKEQFVNAEGISSAEQFEEWMQYTNDQRLDGLLLGGDIIDSPAKGNIRYLGQQLGKLKIPFVYTPGNHDWTQPWEYMTKTAKEEFLPRLRPYMNGNEVIHKMDMGELRIIAVDNSSNQINDRALLTYANLLKTDKKVILLLHVPLLTQSVLEKARNVWSSPVVLGGGNYGGIYPNAASQRFLELTTAADSPVVLVLAGHVHFYNKDYINGKILQIVGPAGYQGRAVRLHIKGK